MRIRRQLHRDARLADTHITAVALPSRPVRRVDEIAVHRYVNGLAVLGDRSIAAIASPTESVEAFVG